MRVLEPLGRARAVAEGRVRLLYIYVPLYYNLACDWSLLVDKCHYAIPARQVQPSCAWRHNLTMLQVHGLYYYCLVLYQQC